MGFTLYLFAVAQFEVKGTAQLPQLAFFSGPHFFLQAALICLLSRSSEIRLAGAGIALLLSLGKYTKSERYLAACNEMS